MYIYIYTHFQEKDQLLMIVFNDADQKGAHHLCPLACCVAWCRKWCQQRLDVPRAVDEACSDQRKEKIHMSPHAQCDSQSFWPTYVTPLSHLADLFVSRGFHPPKKATILTSNYGANLWAVIVVYWLPGRNHPYCIWLEHFCLESNHKGPSIGKGLLKQGSSPFFVRICYFKRPGRWWSTNRIVLHVKYIVMDRYDIFSSKKNDFDED